MPAVGDAWIERERRTAPLPLLFPWLAAADAPSPGARARAGDDWYRIGDGLLAVGGDHAAFRATVAEIFGGCRTTGPAVDAGLPTVRCDVSRVGAHGGVTIDIADGGTFDLQAFTLGVFGERGYAAGVPLVDGWLTVARAESGVLPVFAIRDDRILADDAHRWEGLIANVAIGRLMARQAGCLFFHGATVIVHRRGLMLCGNRRAGKTTLALALAARGHCLFGDEIAALRLATKELLPVRRSLGVRDGPASPAAIARLVAAPGTRVAYPDGEERTRVRVEAIFPGAVPAASRLSAIVLLDGFATAPALSPVSSRGGDRRILTPLAATLWGATGGARAMQLFRLLASTPGYILRAGPPDETAACLERLSTELEDA